MVEEPNINWKLLSLAVEFYTSKGFEYKEVPWIVPRPITEITNPNCGALYSVTQGDLVGSAEQSFLHLQNTNSLQHTNSHSKGFCAVTPCFREEKDISLIRRNYFMKVELMQTFDVGRDSLIHTIYTCLAFFRSCGGKELDIVPTEGGSFDIEYKGVEIGSYGIRRHEDFAWIYATGLAEPRFSQVLNAPEGYKF